MNFIILPALRPGFGTPPFEATANPAPYDWSSYPGGTEPIAPPEFETAPDTGTTPAPVDLIEAVTLEDQVEAIDCHAVYRAQVWNLQVERCDLRIQRAELENLSLDLRWYGGDCSEEWERINSRLNELDDLLIFEPDFDFNAAPWDEFDSDLPDELDGSFSDDGFSAAA